MDESVPSRLELQQFVVRRGLPISSQDIPCTIRVGPEFELRLQKIEQAVDTLTGVLFLAFDCFDCEVIT
jgi:hypothetical protein